MVFVLLCKEGFFSCEIEVLWQCFKVDYFLCYIYKQIVWYCIYLLCYEDSSKFLVLFSKKVICGGMEVFIYIKDQVVLFVIVVVEFD